MNNSLTPLPLCLVWTPAMIHKPRDGCQLTRFTWSSWALGAVQARPSAHFLSRFQPPSALCVFNTYTAHISHIHALSATNNSFFIIDKSVDYFFLISNAFLVWCTKQFSKVTSSDCLFWMTTFNLWQDKWEENRKFDIWEARIRNLLLH